MSNLLAALGSSASALDVLQQALGVVQNNVSNASTPGYASQQLNIGSAPFDIVSGAAGGLLANGLQSSRDTYADTSVQLQLQTLGLYTAQSQSTGTIQSFFDPSGTSGVAGALNDLLTAFSGWSASPSDATARQQVISSATALADSVQGLSQSLNGAAVQLNQQVSSTVDQINALGAQIQHYNVERLKQNQPDPGADANLENNLENLSQLVNLTTLTQPDGTITVLVGGGSPLVIGDQFNSLSASDFVGAQPPPANPEAPPTAHVLDASGKDITENVTGGQLGGLLDSRNRVLSSIIGDGQQAGSLNVFAKTLADTVNGILESGTVSTQAGAAAGAALFAYDDSDGTLAAGSLAVNSAISPDQLAAADSSGNSNGNANALAALGNSNAVNGVIGGENLVGYFAGIASAAGQENQTAQSNQSLQQQVVSQVTATRDQISGVSLDGQAADVLQLQRGYQAVSQVLSIVNNLVDSILALVPQQA
ncbi:MAG TPA: flagellar hook-associated protein FlgK [Bryobacteraceae bacterium]|nr:flagellar hook-associated protein FlgK [Bryobacteraceae bacterium]